MAKGRGASAGAVRVDIIASNAAFTKAIRQSRTRLERFKVQAVKIANSIRRNWRSIGLAISGVVVSIGYGIKTMTAYSSKVVETSRNVGVATKTLENFRAVMVSDGLGADKADQALEAFNRRIGQARQGVGEARRALEALNISLVDQQGIARTNDSLLREVAEKLHNLNDEQLAAAHAADLFSDVGKRMVGVLMNIGGSYDENMKRLGRFNTLTDKQHKANKDLAQATTEWWAALVDLKNRALAPLARPLEKVFRDWTDWVQEIKDSPGVFKDVRDLMVSIAETIENISTAILEAVGALERTKNLSDKWRPSKADATWDHRLLSERFPDLLKNPDSPGRLRNLGNDLDFFVEGNMWTQLHQLKEALLGYPGAIKRDLLSDGPIPDEARLVELIDIYTSRQNAAAHALKNYQKEKANYEQRLEWRKERGERKSFVDFDDTPGAQSLLSEVRESSILFSDIRTRLINYVKAVKEIAESPLEAAEEAVEEAKKKAKPEIDKAKKYFETVGANTEKYRGVRLDMLAMLHGVDLRHESWKPGDPPTPQERFGTPRDPFFDAEKLYNRALLQARKMERLGRKFAEADALSMASFYQLFNREPGDVGFYRRKPNYGFGTRKTTNYGFPEIDPQMAFDYYNPNKGWGKMIGLADSASGMNAAYFKKGKLGEGMMILDMKEGVAIEIPRYDRNAGINRMKAPNWMNLLSGAGASAGTVAGVNVDPQMAFGDYQINNGTFTLWESVRQNKMREKIEEYTKGVKEYYKQLDKVKKKTDEMANALVRWGENMLRNFTNLRDALEDLLSEIGMLLMRQLVTEPLSKTVSGWLGGIFDPAGTDPYSVFGGGKSSSVDFAGIGTNATSGWGASGITIVNNIQSTDGPGVRAALAEATPGIINAAEAQISDNATRFGNTRNMIRGRP